MVNNDEIREPSSNWPVTFEGVEQDHLFQMLKMTPAQRLEMAGELLEFAVLAWAMKDKGANSFKF